MIIFQIILILSFLIGHIRSYAKFLNLQIILKIIEDFKIQISYDKNTFDHEIYKTYFE